jgi:hypothetical protein
MIVRESRSRVKWPIQIGRIERNRAHLRCYDTICDWFVVRRACVVPFQLASFEAAYTSSSTRDDSRAVRRMLLFCGQLGEACIRHFIFPYWSVLRLLLLRIPTLQHHHSHWTTTLGTASSNVQEAGNWPLHNLALDQPGEGVVKIKVDLKPVDVSLARRFSSS